LCLVLAGKQKTGKTEFFRRLFPIPLRRYVCSNKLDDKTDSEILMCQKLFIYDDEYSGKSKEDSKKMKDYLSKDYFTFRVPFGRLPVTRKRIATLGGTCNETDLLNDLTGNRRIIIFEVTERFDYDTFNALDKDQLFAEVTAYVKAGYTGELSDDQILALNQSTDIFKIDLLEEQLLDKYFKEGLTEMTTSDVKLHLEKEVFKDKGINLNLRTNTLGKLLRFKFKRAFQSEKRTYVYKLEKKWTSHYDATNISQFLT